METINRLFLELSQVVPEGTKTARETELLKMSDRYGLALMMIREGCDNPKK